MNTNTTSRAANSRTNPSPAVTNERDSRKLIADSTLKTIEGRYITYIMSGVSRRLDLQAKVKFTNLYTHYYPPDDHDSSRWASDVPISESPGTKTEISIVPLPALDGARLLHDSLPSATSDGRIAILCYASATRPGGGFLDGGEAQEESIARSSTLYPSLTTDTAQQFYKLHQRDRCGGFYHHAMIYSPSIVIFRNCSGEFVTPYEVDVLTCAAVNAGDVRNKNSGHADQAQVERTIEAAMKERMGRILSVLEQHGAKNIILGGFGCGVYRNKVEMVAKLWAELLTMDGARFKSSFDRVVFSILGAKTCDVFHQNFQNASIITKAGHVAK